MRTAILLCTHVIGTGLLAGCQIEHEPLKPHSKHVAAFLESRHAKFANTTSIYAEYKITNEDVVWRTTTKNSAIMRYVRPNLGRLDIQGDDPQSLVVTRDGELWEFRPPTRTVKVFQLPQDAENGFANSAIIPVALQWLLPVDPHTFDSRYELTVVTESDEEIQLKGRRHSGFTTDELEIWIDKKTYFPRKIIVMSMSGNRTICEYTVVKTNMEILPTDFVPAVPDGWKKLVGGTLPNIEAREQGIEPR